MMTDRLRLTQIGLFNSFFQAQDKRNLHLKRNLMSRRFTDPDFEEICVNFWHYAKAHRYGGPRLPPGFAKVLNEGSATYEVDYPLNKYFPALALVIESFDPVEQIAFYAVYISAGYRNGRKIPIKVLASEVGINRANFYKKADSVAQRAWKQAKNLTMLHSKLYKNEEFKID